MVMFRIVRYRNHQKWFCKQFLIKSKELEGNKYYLRHCSKKNRLSSSFCKIALYDVIDNNGMNMLIRSIYKLKNNRKLYSVDTCYRLKKFRKLNYINYNIDGTTAGVIARICLVKNKWIKSISINYTYLNSSQCLIQYTFCFRKIITTYSQIHDFVLYEIKSIKKEFYFHAYADKNIIKKATYKQLWELDGIFFADILQGFICELFYTEYGKEYKLPIEYCIRLHKYNKKKRNKLRNPFLSESYEKDKKHMIISTLSYDRFELFNCDAGKYLPSPSLLQFFSHFSSEIYYKAFYHIEMEELEKKMRKYLNSRKMFVSSKDIKWFINKMRYIKEQKSKIEKILNDNYNNDMLSWKQYYRGTLQSDDFINYPKYTDHFLNLYEQNFEYLNSMASVQNNLVVIIVAVLTLIATLVGILITIIK